MALIGVAVHHHDEELPQRKAQPHREYEEANGLQQCQQEIAAAADAGQQAQGHNAHHIVNDGGAENGGARTGAQLAQLAQRLHRDADAGGGKNAPDKQGVEQLILLDGLGKPTHKQQPHYCTQGDGDKHAQCRSHRGGSAAFLQFFQIRLQPAGK